MADYIEILDAGGTKRKVSVDEVASQFVQRAKLQIGADGEAADVSAANPVPTGDAKALAQLEAIVAALAATIKVGDGSGALTVDGTVSVGNEPTVKPTGNVAHDAADSGNPTKVGARARTELPAAVAQNDRADLMTDKHGRLLVTPAPRDQHGDGRVNLTNTTATNVLAAPGASTIWAVTEILVQNHSSSVNTKVEIIDNETTRMVISAYKEGGGAAPPAPANGVHFYSAEANKAIKAKCATTGADVEVFIAGYKLPA